MIDKCDCIIVYILNLKIIIACEYLQWFNSRIPTATECLKKKNTYYIYKSHNILLHARI